MENTIPAGEGMSTHSNSRVTFPPRRDFSSLSVLDLLQAREAHHVQLSNLDNVIATAIGRYLIHEDDWYAEHSPDKPRPIDMEKPKTPRTLANSVIRAWSWPAVLVFVRSWKESGTLGSQAVPRALYMPDGRVISTCVIEAAPDESLPPTPPGPSQTSSMIGGGYACVRADQGIDRLGSIGCLVYSGGTYYALTSRHVAGEAGKELRAFVGGEYCRVGESANIGLTKLNISQAFPGFAGLSGKLNFDAGLVRVDDFTQWTSQVFGIGEIDEPFFATAHTLTLDLIGTPVRAFGGVSGVMEGEIRALFFQNRSSGGLDSATDVLIGARAQPEIAAPSTPAPPLTRPGDSGTLWFYDPPSDPPRASPDVIAHAVAPNHGEKARRLRPIAMQWGGQRFLQSGGSSAFALGSFISTVCKELDVEIERSWSTGHDEYWGKLGHFAIGWKACDLVKGNLGTLMTANQARIGFDNNVLGRGSAFKMGREGFVPLADVPDYVWVSSHLHPNEPIQHFADVDIVDVNGEQSILERCQNDPNSCSATAWNEYFEGFKAQGLGPNEGALPFRVWQIWEAMVMYASKGDSLHFVAAAGILAHYVGDASQPLHCSYMHHGIPPMKEFQGRQYPVRKESDEFKQFSETPEAKIHGLYEETMLEVDTAQVLADVDAQLEEVDVSDTNVRSGFDAARATLKLMFEAQQRLSPTEIIEADDPTLGPTARAKNLWANKKVREGTITSLAESVKVSAALWHSAWRSGNGDAIVAPNLRVFTEDELQEIYRTERDFIPSMSLEQMAHSGKFEPPAQ